MTFTLPDLPFAKDALGPHMSGETLDFHHGKHHRAYVDKLNELLGDSDLAAGSLVEVIRGAKDKGDKKIFNNAAQHWNHSFFWQCLAAPDAQRPVGRLAELIDECFGGADQMLAKLEEEAVGHFASGWAWLVLDRGKLAITSLHDADTPAVHEGMQPLLTLDLWEHAYYIDYRNERPKYAETVLANIVNWEFVAKNLDGDGLSRADQEAKALAEA
jgi:Fe-Mn family superoxide dismutase